MIYAKFMYPENGHTFQQEKCKELGLELNKEYEMSFIHVGGSSSTVFLKDFPKEYFNSVHFEFYEYVNGLRYEVDVYKRFYNDSDYFQHY